MDTNDKVWAPLPELPIFEDSVKAKISGEWEERFREGIKTEDLYRMAYGNLGMTREEVQRTATIAMMNLVAGAGGPVWTAFANIYFVGVMDALRLCRAQAELDASRVQDGKVM